MAKGLGSLSSEERKERIKKSQKFEQHKVALIKDSYESISKLLNDMELTKEERDSILTHAEKERMKQLRESLIEDKEDVIRSIVDSSIVSIDKKIKIINEIKRAIILGNLHYIVKSRRFARTFKKISGEERFEKILSSPLFTQEERDKVLFNLDKIDDKEFIEIFDKIETIEDIKKLAESVDNKDDI